MDQPLALSANFSQLARQIAMDLLPLDHILELHDLTEDTWERIQADPVFQSTLKDMITDWQSAKNTEARIRIKSATGVEALLEPTIASCMDDGIPLNQRIEGLKFLSKLGRLVDTEDQAGMGERVQINIYTGNPDSDIKTVIDASPINRQDASDA